MAKRQESGALASFDCVQALKQSSERKKAKPPPGAVTPAPKEEKPGAAKLSPADKENKTAPSKPPSRMARSLGAPAPVEKPEPAAPEKTPPSGRGGGAAPAAPAPQPKVAGRAVMPTKRLIVCYHCGYSHTSTGQMHVTYCPKCRKIFETDDVTVDSPRKGDLFTIGDILIKGGAKFDDGAKIAGKVVKIGADISNLSVLTATESLVLLGGANLGGVKLENHGKILVPAGETIEMAGVFTCSELDVAGELRADVRVERGATLRAGAVFRGMYSGPVINVEEGAAINAEMRLAANTGGV